MYRLSAMTSRVLQPKARDDAEQLPVVNLSADTRLAPHTLNPPTCSTTASVSYRATRSR